jgi:hemerythrin superfamily protein
MPESIDDIETTISRSTPPKVALSGVFKKLADEHGELTLLMRYAAESENKGKRSDLYAEIRRRLLAHEYAELKELYPALSIYDGMRQMAAIHSEDTFELATTIKGLDSLVIDGERWTEQFLLLTRLVAQHSYQEETEFFPKAFARIGHDEAERLQGFYESAKLDALVQLE